MSSSNIGLDIKRVLNISSEIRASNVGLYKKQNLDDCSDGVPKQIKYLRHRSIDGKIGDYTEAAKRQEVKNSYSRARQATDDIDEKPRSHDPGDLGSNDGVLATDHKYLKFVSVSSKESSDFDVHNLAKILSSQHASSPSGEWVVFRDYSNVKRRGNKYGGKHNVWARSNLDFINKVGENFNKLSTKHDIDCVWKVGSKTHSNTISVDAFKNVFAPHSKLKEVSKYIGYKERKYLSNHDQFFGTKKSSKYGVDVSNSQRKNFNGSGELPNLCRGEPRIESDRDSKISKMILSSRLLSKRDAALKEIKHDSYGQQVLQRHILNVPHKEGYRDFWSGGGLTMSLEDEVTARNRLLRTQSLRALHQVHGLSSTLTQPAENSLHKPVNRGHNFHQNNLLNRQKYASLYENKDTVSDLHEYIWCYQGMGRQIHGTNHTEFSQGGETEKGFANAKSRLPPILSQTPLSREVSNIDDQREMIYHNDGPKVTSRSDGCDRTCSENTRVQIVVRLPCADEEKE